MNGDQSVATGDTDGRRVWPSLEDGTPVPVSDAGEPCGLCQRYGRRCHHHPSDGSGSPAGRRPKISEGLVEQAGELIEQGALKQTVWAELGVSKSTANRWLDRGRRDEADDRDTLYRDFWDVVTGADAREFNEAMRTWWELAEDDPRALERYIKTRWGGYLDSDGEPRSDPTAGYMVDVSDLVDALQDGFAEREVDSDG